MGLDKPAYLFVFLPLALAVFRVLGARKGREAAFLWLLFVSALFYACADPARLPVLLGTVLFNYWMGRTLARRPDGRLLWLGLAADLGLWASFKYAGSLGPAGSAAGGAWLGELALPLGMSFFIFQQAAYLVDCYAGRRLEHGLRDYALFVLFFPQVAAGPIPRQEETLPQLSHGGRLRAESSDLSTGLSLLSLGLFKTTVLADGVSAFANPVFDGASPPMLMEAWCASLAYSLQLYFDFSGYSDMAIGSARLFGVALPANFDSPYKATDILDFWRRWHISLSRLLRDGVFMPVRLGLRRLPAAAGLAAGVTATFLVSGVWHGSGWTFMIWAGLHAGFMLVFLAWRFARGLAASSPATGSDFARRAGCVLTFLAVNFAWVFFRSPTPGRAWEIVGGMAGLNGTALPGSWQPALGPVAAALSKWGVSFGFAGSFYGTGELAWLTALLLLACCGPNSQELLSRFPHPASPSTETGPGPLWTPSPAWLAAAALLGALAVANMGSASPGSLYGRF